MLVNWLFWLLVPGWKDLILNPATGKISQKNLFGVMGFYVGTALTATIVLTQLAHGRDPDWGVVSFLTLNGLGLTALKIWQQQQNRQTADSAGNALAQPSPPAPANEVRLMPEQPAPAGEQPSTP